MSLAMLRLDPHRLERALHHLVRRRRIGALVGSSGGGTVAAAPGRSVVISSSSLPAARRAAAACDGDLRRGLPSGARGNGVFARRFCSVLPPPSRLACASIRPCSASSCDFAFTSATSSGGSLSKSLSGSRGGSGSRAPRREARARHRQRRREQPVAAWRRERFGRNARRRQRARDADARRLARGRRVLPGAAGLRDAVCDAGAAAACLRACGAETSARSRLRADLEVRHLRPVEKGCGDHLTPAHAIVMAACGAETNPISAG